MSSIDCDAAAEAASYEYVMDCKDEEIARLRAEANGLSEALTDALACEQDYLREIYDLRAEVDALRLDAERYRWLRDADRSDMAIPYESLLMFAGQSLDEEIDIAIGTEKAWGRFKKAMGADA